jgi:hypothetical protein
LKSVGFSTHRLALRGKGGDSFIYDPQRELADNISSALSLELPSKEKSMSDKSMPHTEYGKVSTVVVPFPT